MTLRLPRRDEFIENITYPDDGCAAAVSCLDCPLVKCLHDDPNQLAEQRDKVILAKRLSGATLDELMAEYGLSERTVHRAIQHAKEGHRYRWPESESLVGVTITLEELASRSVFRVKEPWPTMTP